MEIKFKSVTRISKLLTFSLNLSLRESPGDSGEIKVVGLMLLISSGVVKFSECVKTLTLYRLQTQCPP